MLRAIPEPFGSSRFCFGLVWFSDTKEAEWPTLYNYGRFGDELLCAMNAREALEPIVLCFIFL